MHGGRPGDQHGIRGILEDAGEARFGIAPRAERHRLDELEAALGVRFGALPRTPFVWGLDSI